MTPLLRGAVIMWLLSILLLVAATVIGVKYCSDPYPDGEPAHYPVWSLPADPFEHPEPKLVRWPVLRKLHLFRTDLIPYPIMYETYC